jgi:hypothetical protein
MRRAVPSLLIAATLVACGRSQQLASRTFTLEYLDAQEAADVILNEVPGTNLSVSFRAREGDGGPVGDHGRTITVRDTPANLEQIARVLAEFDQRPLVRLHFQLIQADGAARPDSAIADVVAELRKLFRYTGYTLLAQAVVVGSQGSHIEQVVSQGSDRGPGLSSYEQWIISANIDAVRARAESGSVVLRVGVRNPSYGGLETALNARVGQTIVVGNAQLTSRGGTTILTVRPEFVTN